MREASRAQATTWLVVAIASAVLGPLLAAGSAGADSITTPLPMTSLPRSGPEDFSVNLSRLAYPEVSPSAKVVVVNEDDVTSALPAAVLARATSSPLLLARALDLTKAQKQEVARLRPDGAYLVGAASALSDKVSSSLAHAGARQQQRINGNDSADTARRVALLVDDRDAEAKAKGAPAFDAAVVVNPASPDAATGSALAAALRLPVLFTQRDAVSPATTDALAILGITSTLVVGGATSVGPGVMTQLPGAKRLGGSDPTLTSEAVAVESVTRGEPTNVVYVTDGERPVEQAAVGAAVGRLGGIMLAEPDASPAATRRSLDKLGLTARVDRLVVARVDFGGTSTRLRLTLAVLISLIGVATIVVALAHRDDTHGSAQPSPVSHPST
ncbi:MAG: cell wall-binding repeat-containing protein [Acidimicrobiales bacterium]